MRVTSLAGSGFLGALAVAATLSVIPVRAAHAQAEAVPLETKTTPAKDTAALVVQNRAITVFRAPLGATRPADRAEAAARRIQALLEAQTTDSVQSRIVPEGVLVTVAGQPVFSLTPADVDTLAGETLPVATAQAVQRLAAALAAEREERSLAHLLTAAALALLATFLFVIVLRAIRWSRRRLSDRLLAVAASRVPDLRVGGFTLFSSESALALLQRVVDLSAWSAGLFAAYLWLAYVLTRFAYTRPWGEALGGYLRSTVSSLALSAISAVPGIFTVILILAVTRWLTRLVATFFDAVEGGDVDVPWPHPETANATKRIVVALLWMFAIVVAYPYMPGSGSDIFKGVSVFAGIVISLGSSGIVNQAMSGLVLMYARALKPGDYVRIGEVEGTVILLGMLSTKIRTIRREVITLPNAVVVGASVKNYSRTAAETGLLIEASVTIGYDTPWRQVEALLIMAAERTQGIRLSPPPFVLKLGLGDFYVEYQVNAVIERPEERPLVLDRLRGNILDCFNEYGVQIMSPHYESDPRSPAVVPRDRWHAPPARVPVTRNGPAGDAAVSETDS